MKKVIKLIALGIPLALADGAVLAAENTPTISFAGRIQADSTQYSGGSFPYADGSEVRRLRAGVAGDLTSDWEYKIEYDFAPDDAEAKDVYLRYNMDNSRITFGNFKVYTSLDELTSSNNITFTERGLPNALVRARRVAIGYQKWSSRYSLSAAVYGHEINNLERGKGQALRFVFRPEMAEGSILHLGVNATRETPEKDTDRARSRPELHQDSHRIVDTGALTDVDSTLKLGLEAAYINGRFSADGEYIQKSFDRKTTSDLDVSGYYASVSWFLTNDTRGYSNSDGIYGSVSPTADTGAWEIAARISSLDLNDGLVRGGDADAITLAVNYYMTSNLRFQANYVWTESDRRGISDDPEGLQLRVRFTW